MRRLYEVDLDTFITPPSASARRNNAASEIAVSWGGPFQSRGQYIVWINVVQFCKKTHSIFHFV